MNTVLVLASAPPSMSSLHLGKELKTIQHSLSRSLNRDQFRVVTCPAATVDDLRQYLVEYSPTVLHFCGHGFGEEGLCFEDDQGKAHPAPGDALAQLFHLVSDTVKCVVMNACFSEVQAKAISEHIDFVVGMKAEIGDAAAIKFAQGFYEAVWSGRSFDSAFKFGCSAINLAGISEELTPVLLISPRLGGTRLDYSDETQKIENVILRYVNTPYSDKATLTVQGDSLLSIGGPPIEDAVRTNYTSVVVRSVRQTVGGYKKVRAVVRAGLDAGEHTFYLLPKDGTYLVDWEATHGHCQIPYRTYRALGHPTPVLVRVIAAYDNYFNYDFRDRDDDFLSISLRDIDGNDYHGYVRVHLPLAAELHHILEDGERHRLTVRIRNSRETTHVHIMELVSKCWVVPKSS